MSVKQEKINIVVNKKHENVHLLGGHLAPYMIWLPSSSLLWPRMPVATSTTRRSTCGIVVAKHPNSCWVDSRMTTLDIRSRRVLNTDPYSSAGSIRHAVFLLYPVCVASVDASPANYVKSLAPKPTPAACLPTPTAPWCNTSEPFESRVAALVAAMTLKVGFMLTTA